MEKYYDGISFGSSKLVHAIEKQWVKIRCFKQFLKVEIPGHGGTARKCCGKNQKGWETPQTFCGKRFLNFHSMSMKNPNKVGYTGKRCPLYFLRPVI